MLESVAARVPRGPVRDVDGALVRALRYALDLSLMDFASAAGKEKVTAYRWELGGIDEITWLGLLSKFGMRADWMPDADTLERAQTEIRGLRDAQQKRQAKASARKRQ